MTHARSGKQNKSRRVSRRGKSLIARWTGASGGVTRIVVPYTGVITSTGSPAFQAQVQGLFGAGTSSVLYSVPIWNSYVAIFTSARVSEVRVRYLPFKNASTGDGWGAGLAGFFQTNALSSVAPTSSVPSFREACSSARPFVVGRSYSATWRPAANSALRLPFPTNTTAGSPVGGLVWGYAIEQNYAVVTQTLGVLEFEFMVEFFRF